MHPPDKLTHREIVRQAGKFFRQGCVKVVALVTGLSDLIAAGLSATGHMDVQEVAGTSEAGRTPAENEPQLDLTARSRTLTGPCFFRPGIRSRMEVAKTDASLFAGKTTLSSNYTEEPFAK